MLLSVGVYVIERERRLENGGHAVATEVFCVLGREPHSGTRTHDKTAVAAPIATV